MTTLSHALSKNLSATLCRSLFALSAIVAGPLLGACGDDESGGNGHGHGDEDAGFQHSSKFRFFVTSDTSKTGKLGGLKGADARCAALAKAVGAEDHTWHAYLSAEHDDTGSGGPVNARDRIGKGPWHNAKGALVAENLDALHARKGDAEVFLDETGKKINGQWTGSPTPNQHDILTGTSADGTVATGKTCADWTSEATDVVAQVGHSDGLGPMQMTSGTYTSWNSSHESAGCNDTMPRGGAGRIYCFATD